jgi:type II secretory pathway component GspD/PulD (secretin)
VLEQPGGKSLMIVDTPENTRRLLEIKELIDVPALASARFDIYEPKGAAAEELSTAINDLVRSGIIPVEPPQSLALAPLPRGNRILAVSKIDSGLSEARRWLERLDRRAVRPRRIYLYPLQASDSAKAENALAAWVASRQGNPPLRASKPVARIDPPTTCLVFYGTAEEFQELKDVIDPDARVADFKQRLASIEQMFKSESKAQKSESKTEPKTQKRPL